MLPDAHVHFYVCVPPSSDQSVEPPPVVVVGWGSCSEGCSSMRRQHICVRITIHPVLHPPNININRAYFVRKSFQAGTQGVTQCPAELHAILSPPQPILGSSLCAAQNVTICLDFRSLFRRSRTLSLLASCARGAKWREDKHMARNHFCVGSAAVVFIRVSPAEHTLQALAGWAVKRQRSWMYVNKCWKVLFMVLCS